MFFLFRLARLSTLSLVMALLFMTRLTMGQESGTLDDNRIRSYLLAHPEVIIEALEILEARRAREQEELQKASLALHYDALVQSGHHGIMGNPDGDVTLIEFFDYNCRFCRASLATIDLLVKNDPNLRVILKEFPVLGPDSQDVARIAIAALTTDPAKYVELHKSFLQIHGQMNGRLALSQAEKLQFDMEKLKQNLDNPIVDQTIEAVYSAASELGLNGTPTFIIGKEIIPGAIEHDALRAKIDAMRQCGDTAC